MTLLDGSKYTVSGCESDCTDEDEYNQCGCYERASNDTANECTIANVRLCLQKPNLDFSYCNNRCKKPCRYTKYAYKWSSAFFPNNYGFELLQLLRRKAETKDTASKRYLQLNVYPETLDTTYISQRPRYEFFDIFSNIGGLMGLCLGISLITFLEVIEFLFCCIVSTVCRCKTREK